MFEFLIQFQECLHNTWNNFILKILFCQSLNITTQCIRINNILLLINMKYELQPTTPIICHTIMNQISENFTWYFSLNNHFFFFYCILKYQKIDIVYFEQQTFDKIPCLLLNDKLQQTLARARVNGKCVRREKEKSNFHFQ